MENVKKIKQQNFNNTDMFLREAAIPWLFHSILEDDVMRMEEI